jgi:hypothetical protein
MYGSTSISLSVQVTTSEAPAHLTGQFATDSSPGGWLWDRRRLQSEDIVASRYGTFVGGYTHGLKEGTIRDQWVCGSILDTGYLSVAHKKAGEFYTWTPRTQVGTYSVFSDRRTLFSDQSYCQVIEASEDGLMYVDLHEDAVHDSLQVAMYRREDDLIISIFRTFDYVEEFTGEIDEDTDSRLDVEEEGVINVSNISGRKYEYLVDGDRLKLNGDHRLSVGSWALDEVPTVEILEDQGEVYGQGRAVFCKTFPVDSSSCRVFVDEGVGAVEWSRVESLDFVSSSEKSFMVDEELGIMYLGGDQADDLVLKYDMTESTETIFVYENPEAMDTWPSQGIIQIGSEKIIYLEKGVSAFYQCIRAYDSVAAAHSAGDVVENPRRGYAATGDVLVAYDAVPRVDYEVSDCVVRSANKSGWLNILPSRQVNSAGILQITNKEKSIARIELEVDAPSLGGTLYGPMYYGTAATRLIATAYDHQDEPVEDVDLTITITTGTGTLNAQYPSYTDTTNSIGQIYATYNNPFSQDNVETVVDSVSYVGSDTEFAVSGLAEGVEAEDVWVYQVLKHDRIIGTVGLARETTDYVVTGDLYGEAYVDIEGLVDDSYVDGLLIYYQGGTVRVFANITFMETQLDGDDIPFSRIHIDDDLVITPTDEVRLIQAGAIEWDADALNGVRRILYEYTEEAAHPITGEVGAYMPVHPDSISGTTLTFLDRALPTPDPDEDSENLGAYVLVTSSMAKFEATGRDPATGALITSNEIRLQIFLPSTMIGVDLSGALPIPYGWTLATDDFNVGSAIGGANFITINPRSSGINSMCMMAEIS